MKRILFPLVTLSLAAALAGCQQPSGEPMGEFGDAVRHNMALQVIDPEPLVTAPPPELDGARAALAIARYQADSAGRVQGPGPDRQDVEKTQMQVGLPDEAFFKIEK